MHKPKSPFDKWYYDDLDAAQFTSSEILVRTKYGNTTLFFHCERGTFIENRIIKKGLFDPSLLDLMVDLVKPGSTIVDAGANIGAYTAPLAKIFQSCSVHAFEPNPTMLVRLKRNLALNRLTNVTVHEVGLSDECSEKPLFVVSGHNPALSSFISDPASKEKIQAVPTKLETLDNIFAMKDISVSLIKIDVQGYELKVLRGATRLIGKSKPCIILEYEEAVFPTREEANRVRNELEKLLNALNYGVYYISVYGPSLLAPVQWQNLSSSNLLAIPMASQ